MSRICELCGKRTHIGNRIARRGLAKAKGGVGIKTTGVTRRPFKPNIQKVRADVKGTTRRVRICTKCLRAGALKKPRLGAKNRPEGAPARAAASVAAGSTAAAASAADASGPKAEA